MLDRGGLVILVTVLGCACPSTRSPKTSTEQTGPQTETRGAAAVDRVQALHAFARVYGLVKYFHPSDEAAAADWDALAVHGAGRIADVSNRGELRRALEEVFAPIAPTIAITATGATPPPPDALDLGSEEGGDALDLVAWQHRGVGFWAKGGVYQSVRSHRSAQVAISRRTITGALFDAKPEAGEIARVELGAGLTAHVPLALWSRDGHTLPRSDSAARSLTSTLDALPDELSASDERVRVAGVVIAWNVFQHFYPYLDRVCPGWSDALDEALRAARRDADAAGFAEVLRRLVTRVRDGHASVSHQELAEQRGDLRWRVDLVDDQVVVIASEVDGVRVGDVVVRVDGDPAVQRLRADMRFISGSSQWKRARALRRLGRGARDRPAKIVVRRGGRDRRVDVPRVEIRGKSELRDHDRPPIHELDGGIFYIDLDRAAEDDILARIDAIAAAPGVVFDLRGYPNRNHAILSHLLEEPDTSDAWMRIPHIVYPDRERIAGWSESGWNLQPRAPHIEGQVAFITGGMAISYAESVMAFVEHYDLGEIVGGPTAGANGNVNSVGLPGGFRITFTGMKVVKHDGSRHHLVGIRPTVPAGRTLSGIRAGRDEPLERALEVVRAGGQDRGGADRGAR